MKTPLVLLFSFVAVSSLNFGNSLPNPYSIVACNGPGQPNCVLHGTTDIIPVPGLTNAAFQAFFGPSLGAPSGTSYGWLVTDVNNSGVAIGHVMFPLGGGLGDTSFVFDNNQVVCCTADFPFLLNDINDNGFVVGQNPAGLLFGFVADCCSLLSAQTPLAMTFTTPQPELFHNFMGIDDSNNISALGFSGQRYDLFSSPEPGSIVLLAGALFVGALILRRRQVRL